MRIPLYFPSFAALARALNDDPTLLGRSETVVVQETVYSTQHVTTHTDFQAAIRQLYGQRNHGQQNTQQAQQAASSSSAQSSSYSFEYDPNLDDIFEWLAEQPSTAFAPDPIPAPVPIPAPAPAAADSDQVDPSLWVDLEAWAEGLIPPAAANPPPAAADQEVIETVSESESESEIEDTEPQTELCPFDRLSDAEKRERLSQAEGYLRRGRTVAWVQRQCGVSRNKLLTLRAQVAQPNILAEVELTTEQIELVCLIINSQGPSEHNIAETTWTKHSVMILVKQRFGVDLTLKEAKALYNHAIARQQPRTFGQEGQQNDQASVSLRSRMNDTALREIVQKAIKGGAKDAELAARFGVKPTTVRTWRARMRKTGELPLGARIETRIRIHTQTQQQGQTSHGTSSAFTEQSLEQLLTQPIIRPFSALTHEEKIERCSCAIELLFQGQFTENVHKKLNIPHHTVKHWRRLLWEIPTQPATTARQQSYGESAYIPHPNGSGTLLLVTWPKTRMYAPNLRAAGQQALREGMSPVEVAATFGVKLMTVHTWQRRSRLTAQNEQDNESDAELDIDIDLEAASSAPLTPEQIEELATLLLLYLPSNYGLAGNSWDVNTLQQLIRWNYQVEMTHAEVEALCLLPYNWGLAASPPPAPDNDSTDRT